MIVAVAVGVGEIVTVGVIVWFAVAEGLKCEPAEPPLTGRSGLSSGVGFAQADKKTRKTNSGNQ